MVYKIALIGTHGTGKTALVGLIEGELKRRGIEATSIREIPTEARKMGPPINEETTLAAQLWILHRQFAEELSLAQHTPTSPRYQVIICDRGPDNYCYLQHHFGADQGALAMTLTHLRQFPYHRLFLLPIVSTEISDNKSRSVNADFQRKIDREIHSFLKEHAIPFIELPTPSRHDRFRDQWVEIIVNKIMEDLGHPKEFYIQQTLLNFKQNNT